ncbi:MAG: hypothetical protein IJH50_00920 [Kiritimatiellae bacterium]|nr:hypothetical protein [Kiritimatiellia bacterium]
MDNNSKIIIQFALERMENRGNDERTPFDCDFKPEDFKDFARDKEELKARLGRKWRKNLQKIGMFALKYQPITSNYLKKDKKGHPHPVSILNISCTSSYILDLCDKPHPKYANRLIENCRNIGLLVEVKGSYRFGCLNPNKNECKAYAYNKEVEHLVIQTCKEEGTDIKKEPCIDNPLLDRFKDENGLSEEEYGRISLRNSDLNLKNCNVEVVKDIIRKKYSALMTSRLQKIEEMNKTLPPEQRIKFYPNPKYGKNCLRRIALRATSKIVSSKTKKDDNSNYKGIYRAEYLLKYFGGHPYFQYDVHGSIFQVAHLLNYGEWCGDKGIDPYQVMFGQPFKSKEARKAYKLLAMSLYFDEVNRIYAHSLSDIARTNLRYGKPKIKAAIAEEAKKMEAFAGKSLYNEIFLHESLLYIDFVYELRRMGIKVVQIYDGFYFRQGDMGIGNLERLMRVCAMNYLNDYRKWLSVATLQAYGDAA